MLVGYVFCFLEFIQRLIVIDMKEYAGYASDVTRTWPVSGKFTDSQRDVYESVLRVQKECIKVYIYENTIYIWIID
jgi:intermediate cleaving peptidase 55